MYRVTKKRAEQLAQMRAAKERKRLEGPAPDYPAELPDLRRRVTIEDFDTGTQHVIELHKCDRIDCYRAIVDGKPWKARIGWSRVLAGIRKGMPRMAAL
jgi:hypothetical protein